MKAFIKNSICLLVLPFIVTGCTNHSDAKGQMENISYEIISSEYGYGYKIYLNGKLYINQPYIPALPGKAGFVTTDDAEKIAKLASNKIKQGIKPPTITVEELKLAGIIAN